MSTIHVFDYLDAVASAAVPAVCALFGDESFLRRLALVKLRENFQSGSEDAMVTSLDGSQAAWRDVIDELSTFSLFGGKSRRFVVIEEANKFVTENRAQLEGYVERPRSTGVLVLLVDAWPSNTRLYKAIDKSGLQIECRAPEAVINRRKAIDDTRILRWLAERSQRQHEARLEAKAARLLWELVGPQFGILEQELAKLALFAGKQGKITEEMVRDVVGGWRTKTIWELLDAALDGDAAQALEQLDRMFQAGEHPLALFGPAAAALRRFPTAARIYQQAEKAGQPIPLRAALLQAGVPNWPKALDNAERHLKQLGRQRALALGRWILDTDLALKGTHSSPDRGRFALEQLVLRLSRAAAPLPRTSTTSR